MLKLTAVRTLPGYKLHLQYADGVVGDIDLSWLVGKGVFRLWNDPQAFQNVSIGSAGELRWSDEVDLCSDALYMQVSGKPPEEVFPDIGKAAIHV